MNPISAMRQIFSMPAVASPAAIPDAEDSNPAAPARQTALRTAALRRYGLVKKLHRAAARGRHHRRAGGRLRRRRSAGSAVLGVTRSRPRRARRAPADMRLVQCADRRNTDTPSSGPPMLPSSPMLLEIHRDDHTPLLSMRWLPRLRLRRASLPSGQTPWLGLPILFVSSCRSRLEGRPT